MRPTFLVVISVMISFNCIAQKTNDVITAFSTNVQDTSKALIMYISGDGGLNIFSKGFCQQLSDKGYPVVLLNSLKYFWSKKPALQASADVQKIIRSYKALWKRSRVILIGYSFGADVTPFVFNRLAPDLQKSIEEIVLLSPSPTTDFEVHLLELFGRKQTRGLSVVNELNKITNKPLVIFQGEKEADKFDVASLKVRNYKVVTLVGGHHYDKDPNELTDAVLRSLR